MTRKALIAWSSGKDSAKGLHEVRRAGRFEIVAAMTTVVRSEPRRISMHGLRESLLDRQADALGLPIVKVELPSFPCSNQVYEKAVGEVLERFRKEGGEHVVFGDLFLEDIRAYRQAQMAGHGLEGLFPLWGRDTRELAQEMIADGFRATLVAVDSGRLDRAFVGRPFDLELLADLPPEIDPCGENGEFHTFVSDGPGFREPIAFQIGPTHEKNGFVFADLE